MSDPRLTPANGRAVLAGHGITPEGRVVTQGVARHVARPLVDLCRSPDGARDRQLRLGAQVQEIEAQDGWSFVRHDADGYVGYVPSAALGVPRALTHRISARASHLYTAPKVQAPERTALPFDARVQVTSIEGDFARTPDGYIPTQHLRHLDDPFKDAIDLAEMFLGVPYLWGGNSIWGLDCSGLVQQCCAACGIACPGDADLQQASLGQELPRVTPPQRGDAIFWRGHVALVYDAEHLIHANGTSMDVTIEPMQVAIDRIARSEYGKITAIRRFM